MAKFPGNLSMVQRIAQATPTLIRSPRKMADDGLDHPAQVATRAIDELAVGLGVSVSTANRFARALEFGGYHLPDPARAMPVFRPGC